jgi:hypothetical protein
MNYLFGEPMIINKLYTSVLTGLLVISLGCSKDSDSDSDDADDEDSGSGTSEIESIEDLKLSSVLNLSLPDSILGEGTGLRLQDSGKSKEACELRNTIRQNVNFLATFSPIFCYLEAASDKIEVGEKYTVTEEDGTETGLLMENGADGAKVTICQNGDPVLYFAITDAKAGGAAKGNLILKMAADDSDIILNSLLDVGYTEEGRITLVNKLKFGTLLNSLFGMDLSAEGTAIIKSALNANFEGSTYDITSAAKVGEEYGMIITNTGYVDGETTTNTATTNYFDAAGQIVEADVSPELAEGGSVYVATSDVPAPLTADFDAGDFPDDIWDCTGGTETTDIDFGTDEDLAAACEAPETLEDEDCDDEAAYMEGEAIEEFDPSENEEISEETL